MALLGGEFTLLYFPSLFPFLGLRFCLMLSFSPHPPFPSIRLFYLLHFSAFPSHSFSTRRPWWSQLYSWESNTQNCSVSWINARCLRSPESSPKDSVSLFNWLASMYEHSHMRGQIYVHHYYLYATHIKKKEQCNNLVIKWMPASFLGEGGERQNWMSA